MRERRHGDGETESEGNERGRTGDRWEEGRRGDEERGDTGIVGAFGIGHDIIGSFRWREGLQI